MPRAYAIRNVEVCSDYGVVAMLIEDGVRQKKARGHVAV